MRKNFSTSSVTETLRRDLRMLADDASKLAQTHVMDPAMNAVRHARAAAIDRATEAERYTAQQCDHIAQLITAKPFTAVAVAFASGMLVAGFLGHGPLRHASA